MRTADLDYDLPPDRIAAEPVQPRDAARLMVIDRATGRISHHHVRDLPDLGLLQSGDVMVFNNTKVIPARFHGRREKTGGRVEGLYLGSAADNGHIWSILLETRGRLVPGERIALDETAHLRLLEKHPAGRWTAALESDQDTLTILHRLGTTPLPPYIRRVRRLRGMAEVREDDAQRYNTIYAAVPGSVAAPTAGLHFTPQLLERLDALGVIRRFVTLHVGVGTFAPIRTARLEQHRMEAEWISVPAETVQALREARQTGRRILCVGTTTVRALESLPQPLPDEYCGLTDLFIYSGFTFRFTDALFTNFHLPRSTLLALVAALPGVGIQRLKAWYALAIQEGYRFYSYGDAMLIV